MTVERHEITNDHPLFFPVFATGNVCPTVRNILIHLEANGVIDPTTELVDVTDELNCSRGRDAKGILNAGLHWCTCRSHCALTVVHLRTVTKDVSAIGTCIGGVPCGESLTRQPNAKAEDQGRPESAALFPVQYGGCFYRHCMLSQSMTVRS